MKAKLLIEIKGISNQKMTPANFLKNCDKKTNVLFILSQNINDYPYYKDNQITENIITGMR